MVAGWVLAICVVGGTELACVAADWVVEGRTPEGCDADAGSPVVDAGVGCPAVRPHIGTPCATANQSCDYDACEGNVNLECVGGLWEDAPIECGSQAQ